MIIGMKEEIDPMKGKVKRKLRSKRKCFPKN